MAILNSHCSSNDAIVNFPTNLALPSIPLSTMLMQVAPHHFARIIGGVVSLMGFLIRIVRCGSSSYTFSILEKRGAALRGKLVLVVHKEHSVPV